jgi:iron-sulfur cluster repair protein YtfE (RIC family)
MGYTFHLSSEQIAASQPITRLYFAIERLKEEHALLQEELRELYRLTKRIARQEHDGLHGIEALRDLRKRAAEFQADLDKHAKWEETEVFPLVSVYFNSGLEQLMRMEQEHELAEQFADAFAEAAKRAPVRRFDSREMAMYLQQAHSTLKEHFRHEEEVLSAIWEQSEAYGY